MAGGLTGTGTQRSGAATKKILAHLRDICPEARSRSNQELVLLLENFNDQVVAVADSLRSGDAGSVLGGWATTSKKAKSGKSKKSESDTGNENASVASSGQSKPVSAPSQNSSRTNGNSANSNTSNANNQQTSSRPLDPIGTIKPQQTQDTKQKKQQDVTQKSTQQSTPSAPQVKDVPAPDMHTYLSDFSRLQHQLNEVLVDDLEALELAFEQARRAMDHRHDSLRRNLLRQKEEASEILLQRHTQARQLTDRLTSSDALTTLQLEDYRQVVSTFASDYKFDLHLASVNRFAYTLEPLQKELNKFGNVFEFMPVYTYKSAPSPAVVRQSSTSFSQQNNQQQQNHQLNGNNNNFNGRSNQQQNNNGFPSSQNHTQNSNGRANNNSSSQNQGGRNSNSATSNSNGGGNNSNGNKSRSSNSTSDRRGSNNNNSSNNNNNNRNSISQNVPHVEAPKRERVTIMANEGQGAAPMNSLVISGDLSPEEMAEIMKSVQLNYLPPSKPQPPKQPKSLFENGSGFSEADLLANGASAIWTNSSASFETNTNWNNNSEENQNNNNSDLNGNAIKPVGDHLEHSGGVPRRGGPAGRRGGSAFARGNSNRGNSNRGNRGN